MFVGKLANKFPSEHGCRSATGENIPRSRNGTDRTAYPIHHCTDNIWGMIEFQSVTGSFVNAEFTPKSWKAAFSAAVSTLACVFSLSMNKKLKIVQQGRLQA